jgi:hypothetical protein
MTKDLVFACPRHRPFPIVKRLRKEKNTKLVSSSYKCTFHLDREEVCKNQDDFIEFGNSEKPLDMNRSLCILPPLGKWPL